MPASSAERPASRQSRSNQRSITRTIDMIRFRCRELVVDHADVSLMAETGSAHADPRADQHRAGVWESSHVLVGAAD
jgi:hypothetical protein